MIDHTGVNVTNFEKSCDFYSKALAPLGYKLIMEFPIEEGGKNAVGGFGEPPKPDFWISEAPPQRPHVHVAFRAKDRKTVDDFYAAAIAAGGKDNGKPGPRPHYHDKYYGAFVIDLDGHNIEAVCHE